MRISAINTVYQHRPNVRHELKSKQNETHLLRTAQNPSFKGDGGALRGMLYGAGVGLAAAAVVVLTGGAAAVGLPAVTALGAGAGLGAEGGGIIGGLADND